jgi:hypothetical protein
MAALILYHGTDKEAAAKIRAKGFKCSDCSDFGKAVYFSDLHEWAKEYEGKEGETLPVLFTGKLLDLQIDIHFEIYKQLGNYPHLTIKKHGFDALKDNHIIAVYNKKVLTLIN